MAHRRLGALYARSFERRPWLTLAVANGTLGVLADTLAQTLERYRKGDTAKAVVISQQAASPDSGHLAQLAQSVKETFSDDEASTAAPTWDVVRSARFFAFGVGMAPLLAEWNKFIEHRFPLRVLSGTGNKMAIKVSMGALAKRVAVDQIAFAPFGLVCFVGAMGVMEGRSQAQLRDKFQEMYMPALLANWQLWPVVQTINFRFMPLAYRVPFTGAIGIAWQVFLSILNARRSSATQDSAAAKLKAA